MPKPPFPWHASTVEEAVQEWQTDLSSGLGEEEVVARRARLGENVLPQAPKEPWWKQLLEQFINPLVMTLLAAAVIAAVVATLEPAAGVSGLQRYSDVIAIALIVIINALLGFFQEQRAAKALDALQKMAAPSAKVRRGAKVTVVPASSLVPGDVVELETGDQIPADLRLADSADIDVQEATLTGESTAVSKRAGALCSEDAPLAERRNMLYMGTSVVRGRGFALVVQTGADTELGHIGALMAAAKEEPTPLEMRLAVFGKWILFACLAVSAVVFAVGIIRGGQTVAGLLLTAVSLAVAAIPEGLPAITTITLALGMQRMARRGAIVRKLPAVETLGCATYVCSDKTGTMTQNQMTVRAVVAGGTALEVEGEGYRPVGRLLRDGAPVDSTTMPDLALLARAAALCNTARLEEKDGQWQVLGDPTEGALLTLAAKIGQARDSLTPGHALVREIPFSSDRRMMTVIVREPGGTERAYLKGGAEQILPRCRWLRIDGNRVLATEENLHTILDDADSLAARALRVLAIAWKPEVGDDPEEELELLGLVGMMDPPRAEVRDAVAEALSAGVQVVMITGDHRNTAVAIAKELGMWREGDLAVSGGELDTLSDQLLEERVGRVRVFARVTAEHKLRIVRALRARGQVTAMTGDGVNDAPAIKESHIGVAMGRGGTDVAREAADMVLADDNFATIVVAVREGRAIFRNIQKFIFFLLSSNAGLVLLVFFASMLDWAEPLTPLQILWINLVTNGLPALALGIDPPDPGQMREKPRRISEGILGNRDYLAMLAVGLIMAMAALYLYARAGIGAGHDETAAQHAVHMAHARTLVFTLLALSPLFHTFNCRSKTASAFKGLFSNKFLWGANALSAGIQLLTMTPALRPVFKTTWMTASDWVLVLGLSALPILAFEVWKLLIRFTSQRSG